MDPTGITDVQDAHDFDTPGGIPDPQTFTITSGGGGTGTVDWYTTRGGGAGSVTPSPLRLADYITLDRVRKGVSGSFAQILLNRLSGQPAMSAFFGRYPDATFKFTVTAGSFTLTRTGADAIGSGFARWNLDAADTNIANSVSTGDTVTLLVTYG